MNTGLKDKKGILDDLDNIENVYDVLDDEELRLINLVFQELEGFNQITDYLERALTDNRISHYQFKKIFKTMIKVVYYKVSVNTPLQPKKRLIRAFFELPETIHKKIELYILRNMI
jgi:hypothetical protein